MTELGGRNKAEIALPNSQCKAVRSLDLNLINYTLL